MTPDLPSVGWAMAFLAGTVSFLSPCVMPLIPGYLSYVSGVSLGESHGAVPGGSARVLGQSLLFVLGFTVVFVALGATASTIGAAGTSSSTASSRPSPRTAPNCASAPVK